MKFKLIYGKSGSGKSEYIYKDIKNNGSNKNIFIIVPEQSNLNAEKKLFEITEKQSLINIQVLTLSRCAYHIANEVGGSKIIHLSKVGKDMLIYDLLVKYKSDLKFLGKSDKNIDVVDNMITEFKKHNISVQDLYNLEVEDKYMKLKFEDIAILYEKYEQSLGDFIDENDKLNILAESLENSKMFENSLIYIDEFMGFTAQEYKVFEKLINKCDEMTVTVCTDSLLEASTNYEDGLLDVGDIFYFNKRFAKKLLDIAIKNKCNIEKIHLENQYRNANDVGLFLASNPYTELEYVAKTIYNLVKKDEYKYNEIGVITEDLDYYSEYAKSIFAKYNIPLFIDEKKTLNQNILIKYILAMLNIFSENWSFDAMFNYLKIDLLNIDKNNIYALENYCKKWGIRGSKWYNKEFNYEPVNENQEMLEGLRKRVVEPLMNFKNKVSENKTVEEITKEIYKFLIENNINKTLNEKLKQYNNTQISDEYNTSYKVLINVLEEIVLIFKDQKTTFEKYKELLQIGLNSSEIGKIPATQDQVLLGDAERTRNNKIKALFIIGVNDGSFPKNNRVEGYLNDKDREVMKQAGLEVANTSIENLYEEQFNIYRILNMPEEKLFLSYCSSDKDGKTLRPSALLKKLGTFLVDKDMTLVEGVFPKPFSPTNEFVTFEEALNAYKNYLNNEDVLAEWENALRYFYNKDRKKINDAIAGIYYTNKAQEISENNMNKLYGNTLKTSVSKLENYRRCPFSFHLKYGLNLKETENLKVEAIDTGTIMHEVIDLFFKEIDEENINIKQIEENKITEIVNKIIDELLQMSKYYIFSSNAKFKLLTRRLKKIITRSIEYIIYTLKYSDFEVLGHEIDFKDNGKYKPIEITLEDNKKVQITGKIDRVDIGVLDGNKYVRVIDYKSSIKKVDLNEALEGLQIQLITYLDAISEQENFNPRWNFVFKFNR